MLIVCGFLGLAIDVGRMRAAEQKVQSAANADSAIIDSGAKFTIGNDYSSLHVHSPVKSGAVLMQ